MRVTPVGLLPLARHGLTCEQRAAIAQFQGALTHGHATALAASDLTAQATVDLLEGGDAAGLVERLLEYARQQRSIYHADYLGDLWQRCGARSPEEYIASGWDECLQILQRLERAAQRADRDADVCQSLGEAWIAEEAMGCGLLAFLLFPDDPQAALQRAATSNGDSDSIACLTGAFAGAACGMSAWPSSWAERIEYRARLTKLAEWLAGLPCRPIACV